MKNNFEQLSYWYILASQEIDSKFLTPPTQKMNLSSISSRDKLWRHKTIYWSNNIIYLKHKFHFVLRIHKKPNLTVPTLFLLFCKIFAKRSASLYPRSSRVHLLIASLRKKFVEGLGQPHNFPFTLMNLIHSLKITCALNGFSVTNNCHTHLMCFLTVVVKNTWHLSVFVCVNHIIKCRHSKRY